MSSNNQVIKTIIISGLAMLINYMISFFITPYISENMGSEAYGFFSIAKTFSSYAAILTLAIDSYAVRFIGVEYHNNRFDKCSIYFSSVYYADLFVSTVLILLIIIFSFFIEHILVVPEHFAADVKLMFVLMIINFGLITVSTAFTSASYIKNKLDIMNAAKGISYIIEALVMIILYKSFPPRIYYAGIAMVCSALVILISNVLLCKKLLPELKIHKKHYSFSAVKLLLINGIWNSLNSLGNMLNSGLDLIVSNLMLTGLQTGNLAISKTIGALFSGLLQLIAQPFQPALLKIYSSGNNEELIRELKKAMIVCGFFSNAAFAGFVAIGKEYCDLWVPTQDTQLIYTLTIVTVLGNIAEGALYPLYYIYTLTVKNKIPCFVTIIGGIANVLFMYILINLTNLGEFAIVWTTAVITSIINLVFNPLYMSKCLDISYKTFYDIIAVHILSCIAMTAVFKFMVRSMSINSWIALILTAVLLVFIGVIIHAILNFFNRKISNLRRIQ